VARAHAHSITTFGGAAISCTMSSRRAPTIPVSIACITGFPELSRSSSERESSTEGGPIS
jgi:hypothetical protein